MTLLDQTTPWGQNLPWGKYCPLYNRVVHQQPHQEHTDGNQCTKRLTEGEEEEMKHTNGPMDLRKEFPPLPPERGLVNVQC